MKKIALTSLFVIISAASSMVFASQQTFGAGGAPGAGHGFTGGAGGAAGYGMITTVRGVLDAGPYADDMPVTLTGNILKRLGGEMYVFSDGTGEVNVEIDHDKWFGQSTTPTTTVVINGEIDQEHYGVKIDVERILVQN